MFYNLNMLTNHNLLPEAGGTNDQSPQDMDDIRTLQRILRRLQWEHDQGRRPATQFDRGRDFFDAMEFQTEPTGSLFNR